MTGDLSEDEQGDFKYVWCVLGKSGTELTKCSWNIVSGKRVTGATRSLVNANDMQLKCARVLHETLLLLLLMYGSKTMLWKEKEIFRIRDVQMDNLKGLLGFRRTERNPNARIMEFLQRKK